MSRNFLLLMVALVSTLTVSMATYATPVTDLKKIVLGKNHGCGITRAGALRCFGSNGNGQLGTAQRLPNSFARHGLTVLPAGVTDVAIGDEHTCAVMDDKLFCWGRNDEGQLGTGKAGGDIKTPARAIAVSGVVASVAAGGSTTCVILAPNGALQCWGRNQLHQVVYGAEDEVSLQPVTVIPSGVTAVAIGGQHSCAVVNGGLTCWGFLLFSDGQSRVLPKPITVFRAGQGVTAVAVAMHTCAIVKESLQCWGSNFYNQVGVPEGSRLAPKVPTIVVPSGVTAMALSDENTCAVVKRTLMCWGGNNNVQLGTLTSPGSSIPIPIVVPSAPPATINAIAIGMRQVCVLTDATTARDASILQCTNRAPDPVDVDDTVPPPPREQWFAFGTEGVGLSEPPPVRPRIARYGLWQGSIGTQNVMVLLAPQACDARYYYRKHLFSISLAEKDRRQGRVWRESPDTDREATWTFSVLSLDGRTLTGEWVSRDGQHRQPIRLNLMALTPAKEGGDGKAIYDCTLLHNKAFDAPRIAHVLQKRTVADSDSIFQGGDGSYRYRPVSILGGQIKGFTLPDISRYPRLRQAMENWESDSVAQYYDCAFGMASSNGAADFYFELSPLFWDARMLVLRETYSNDCGGAHPNGGVSDYRVWDLVTDHPVAVWKWIKGSDNYIHITSKRLQNLLAARYSRRNEPGDDSCANILDGNEYYLMYPRSTGMVFSPSLPHVVQTCEEDIEIPWVEMRPFLSPAGKKAQKILFGVP